MAEFKNAFSSLRPLSWDEVPSGDDLGPWLEDVWKDAEVLSNSIPIPAAHDGHKIAKSSVGEAQTASETAVEPAQTELDDKHAALQKNWGKPLKINAKDNPLHVTMYKTAGTDRKGAWFARRSMHAGIDFDTWKAVMKREFAISVKVKGGPGSGAIRGLAGDRRVENIQAGDTGTAQGPVSPRDFVTLLLTSKNALSSASTATGSDKPPRHFCVVSRPVSHSDADEREGLVRGTYESVEMIREVPGTGDGDSPPLIEWIMITRSDPGGGIPKFMVERGTPSSIVADVPKFIEWVLKHRKKITEFDDKDDELLISVASKADEDAEVASVPDMSTTEKATDHVRKASKSVGDLATLITPANPPPYNAQGNSSLLGNLTTAVGSTVAGYLPYFANGKTDHATDDSTESDSSSDADSVFASAVETNHTAFFDAESRLPDSSRKSLVTEESFGSTESVASGDSKHKNQHEKELMKLKAKREALDAKMAKVREDELRRSQELTEKEQAEAKKIHDKHEREKQKHEEKWQKELRRIESRRIKEESKAQATREKDAVRADKKRQRQDEKAALGKLKHENADLRKRLERASEDAALLSASCAQLQRANTLLVAALGQADGGAVQRVQQQLQAENKGAAAPLPLSRTPTPDSLVGDKQ